MKITKRSQVDYALNEKDNSLALRGINTRRSMVDAELHTGAQYTK